MTILLYHSMILLFHAHDDINTYIKVLSMNDIIASMGEGGHPHQKCEPRVRSDGRTQEQWNVETKKKQKVFCGFEKSATRFGWNAVLYSILAEKMNAIVQIVCPRTVYEIHPPSPLRKKNHISNFALFVSGSPWWVSVEHRYTGSGSFVEVFFLFFSMFIRSNFHPRDEKFTASILVLKLKHDVETHRSIRLQCVFSFWFNFLPLRKFRRFEIFCI